MQNLRVTLIQADLKWEDIDHNLLHFSHKIKLVANNTDLIILPEMFSTGFSMKPNRVAESMDGKTMTWLTQQAKLTNAVVTGSFIAKEGDNYFNRLVWMQPDGDYQIYDKKHLFTLAKEDEAYVAGKERLIVEWKGWKICPLICYDLRFPAWSRNSVGYDLLIYIASWPTPRIDAWQALLKARAIENQSYTIGVNRVGKDENQYHYTGASSVFDFAGKTKYQIFDQEDIFTTELSLINQQEFREKLNFLADQDRFSFD